tara:strand:+ start:231 stop:794 length:564 start_codon:yes stop_codon:yes gene_type:complete
MNKQSILVYNFNALFQILSEIKEIFNFRIFKIDKKSELLNINSSKYGNYLILTNEQIPNLNNIFVIKSKPIKINNIVEEINIRLLKQRYNYQSNINLKKYNLDINSREISKNSKKLKLTQKELEILIFLKENIEPQKAEVLQQRVWGYNLESETHTVETHVYRLRKKIRDVFSEDGLIESTDKGYKL